MLDQIEDKYLKDKAGRFHTEMTRVLDFCESKLTKALTFEQRAANHLKFFTREQQRLEQL